MSPVVALSLGACSDASAGPEAGADVEDVRDKPGIADDDACDENLSSTTRSPSSDRP